MIFFLFSVFFLPLSEEQILNFEYRLEAWIKLRQLFLSICHCIKAHYYDQEMRK